MSAPERLKYRAFLSYSHRDTRLARKVHARLEGFRIDKVLVGRKTAMGPIPKSLRPIFRDRHDFNAGGSLQEQTKAALDASAALIVLASQGAAKSGPVNEEVRLFKAHHPDRPVIPLVAESATGDIERDCFPPALRFEVDVEGKIADRPAALLAADMRPEADGRELALAKVAARLIGLPPDDVYRRAERHRRRQAQMRNLVIAVLAVLVVVAGASAWFYREELRRNDALLAATLKTATGIVSSAVEQAESHGVPRALTIGLLARAEELFDDMARYGRPTRQLRHRRAWMLIEFARSHSILGDTEKRVARAEEALAILRQLTTEYPGETEYQIDLANALMQVGHARIAQGATKGAGELYDASAAVLRRLMALGQRDDSVIGPLASVYSFIGGVAQSRGLLNEAIDNHRKTLALLEDLGAKDTVGKSYAGRIAGAHRAIGDALLSKGRFGEAKLHFEDCAKQVRAVLDEHPHDHASKGVLSWCLSRIANTLQAAGKAKEGIEIETSILEMRLALLKIDPKNARWLRDRYWSYIRLGDLKLGENDSAAALKDYETALGYVLSAVKQDEHNRILQRELAVVHTRIGNVFLDAGRPAAALDAYQKGYGILRALSEGDRGNLVWKCDLARANNSIADAQRSSGSYLEALASIEQAVAIYRSILAESPGHEAWLGNLAVSFEQLGEVHADNGAAEKALEPFHASREIWTKLAADAAPDPRAGRFLAAINQKIEAISSKSSQPIQAAPTVRRMRTADCGLPLMFVAWL